ncbi:KilA-N domain-containing protein [Agarilytica rhodophyticola]|uniref:KilA-N domain-containing protein n=1 Tax=Agarilytica rhodophyticola TaxID=1737490 RepID=UPI00131549E2|nr:KilA-N domain-containing protein [Agarilytica rhodophyticola]
MSKSLIKAEYKGAKFQFTEDAWFNATEAANHFSKRVRNWLRTDETKEYMDALAEVLNSSDVSCLVKTTRGKNGATWLHPRLAVPFARWLNTRFAVWCDIQIDQLIRGKHKHQHWKKLRHESAASYKVLSDMLRLSRDSQGKSTSSVHYMSEAKLVNWALKGEFKGLDRDSLTEQELDILAKLEVKETFLIAQNVEYKERKPILLSYANELKESYSIKRLEASR